METKTILKRIIKAIKNHNKIYSFGAFWALWLFLVVGHYQGTKMALITFFVGFCITALGAAYITDNPNKKEKKTLDKIISVWMDAE